MVNRLGIAIIVVLVIAVITAAAVLSFPPGPSNGSSSTTSGASGGSTGKMAVMGTDPPYSPSGSSAEYAHYSNVAAHKSQSGGRSTTSSSTTQGSQSSGAGWVMLDESGSLKLNALVNSSETLALANVSAGTYDAVRLYVDSAEVTYDGQNYSATVTGNGQITASLTGSSQVTSSSTTVIIYDLRTVILNAGSSSTPQFVLTSSARAEVVPSGDVASASLHVGALTDLSGSAWFKTFVQGNARLQVSSAAISTGSLNVTIRDTGTEPANVTLVIVTPASILAGAQVVVPASLQGCAVFVVGAGGSLSASSSGPLLAQVESPGSGLSVSSSSAATLTFAGTIQFSSALGTQVGVTPGQSYLVTVIGTNTVATMTITAT